jgi:hypothetical protein
MNKQTPLNRSPYIFNIGDAVYFNEKLGRVIDRAVDAHGENLYLVQMSNHLFHWVHEENLGGFNG